tara:strand:+ start:1467 stop:1982 length:516 start_codon:yes stop_codon:yes gene_type:complete
MLKNVQQELNRFSKYVIQQSRTNLTKGKKNSSKDLYNSLDYDLTVSPNSFALSFLMEEYGIYQDKGVSGKKVKYNTPFSYKDKMPPPSKLDKWIVRKGLKGIRDKKGKFISRKSLQFMIARGIFNNGIKPSLFFTKPFERAFKRLDADIIKAYELDVEELLKFTTNGNNKR